MNEVNELDQDLTANIRTYIIIPQLHILQSVTNNTMTSHKHSTNRMITNFCPASPGAAQTSKQHRSRSPKSSAANVPTLHTLEEIVNTGLAIVLQSNSTAVHRVQQELKLNPYNGLRESFRCVRFYPTI